MPSLQPLAWELAHYPRCGLCAFFPINHVGKYPCPIGQRYVHRRNKPLSKPGKHFGGHNYRCFLPITEYAYELYKAYWQNREAQANMDYGVRKKQYSTPRVKKTPEEIREQQRLYLKKKRKENPVVHREEVKDWRARNPEKVEAAAKRYNERHRDEIKNKHRERYLANKDVFKERSAFRAIIIQFDPMEKVRRAFRYAKYVEKHGVVKRTEEQKAERRRQYDEMKAKKALVTLVAPITIVTPVTPPIDIPLDKPRTQKRPGSKKRQLWQTHPDKYREQQEKFKRLEML